VWGRALVSGRAWESVSGRAWESVSGIAWALVLGRVWERGLEMVLGFLKESRLVGSFDFE
jgi:hypothetical protein